MKRVLVLALFAVAFGSSLYAQVVDTTVCAVLKDPKSFDGKIVRIKGTVSAGLDQFLIKDGDCGELVNGIWLSYPQGTKAKSGPIALVTIQPAHNFGGSYTAPVRAAVVLDKSKDFKQFDSQLAQIHGKDPGVCLGCTRNEVTATLTGRLDGVGDASLQRDPSGKIVSLGGFGNLNAYPARLVLQSVSDVASKPVNYSAADSVVKGEPIVSSITFDAHDAAGIANQMAAAMGKDDGAVAVQKAAGEFKNNNHPGVNIAYGVTSEVGGGDDVQSTQDSPDGVFFNCTFNVEKLPKPEQSAAVFHIGQHIIDLRAQTANEIATPFIFEYNAWIVTAAGVARTGGRFLTLPGGNLLFSSTWPPADVGGKMKDALTDFLGKEEMFHQ
jgi:hypothetical protein